VPVRLADRHVVVVGRVLLVDREYAFGGEPVDRGYDRRADQARVAERQEVVAVVNQIEVRSALEQLRNVQALPDLRIDAWVFGVSTWGDTDEPR
jgi:hypothetical protein